MKTTRTALWFPVLLMSGICLAAQPQLRDARHSVDIPSQDLDGALQALALAAGQKLLYPSTVVEGKKSQALKGEFTTEQAVKRLLAGTGLTYELTADGMVLIRGAGTKSSLGIAGDQMRVAMEPQGQQTAQQQAAAKVEEGDELEVKDSRIVINNRNIDRPRTVNDVQAYTIFDAETIERSGAINTEDFLKKFLTMNTQETTTGQLDNAIPQLYTGTSSIDLRGLGTDGTLILVNGRARPGVAAGSGFRQADLNMIPLEAIARIEVLPSSASALYGGSAIGGVVNIILKATYTGGTVKAQFDDTADGKAPRHSTTASYGWRLEGGRTSVNLMGRYADGQAMLGGDRREIAERNLRTVYQNRPATIGTSFSGGSTSNITLLTTSFTPPGSTTPFVNPPGTTLILKDGRVLPSNITYVPYGVTGATLANGLLANAGRINLDFGPNHGNYGTLRQLGASPALAKSVMGTVTRQMTDRLELYGEFSIESSRTRNNGSVLFGRLNLAGNNVNNPFQQNISFSLPLVRDTPSLSKNATRSFTAGMRADLPHSWKVLADYTFSRASFSQFSGNYETGLLQEAIHAGTINPFVDLSVAPLHLDNYLSNLYYDFRNRQHQINLRVHGDLPGFLPWSAAPNLIVGGQRTVSKIDDGSHLFDVHPLNPAVSANTWYYPNSNTVTSAYAELNVPLVQPSPTRLLLKQLDVQIAGRHDRYEVDGGTQSRREVPNATPPTVTYTPNFPPYETVTSYTSTNPTLGLLYKPFQSLMLRASMARAFLPPTFQQLTPNAVPSTNPTTIQDPNLGNISYDIQTIGGGNADLQPKRSKSFTAGIVFEPRGISLLEGARFNVEYYNIKQTDVIGSLNAQTLINDPDFQFRVTRSPTTGRITLVDTSNLNLTSYETKGYDANISYARNTPAGRFNLRLAGTFIDSEVRQLALNGPSYDYAGFPAEGGPIKRRGTANVTWQRGPISAGWTVTAFPSYPQVNAPGSPNTLRGIGNQNTIIAQGSTHVDSQAYHDLYLSYTFEGQSRGWAGFFNDVTLDGGLKNVFDTVPPFDANRSPWYYSMWGDVRLRQYWLSLRKEF